MNNAEYHDPTNSSLIILLTLAPRAAAALHVSQRYATASYQSPICYTPLFMKNIT